MEYITVDGKIVILIFLFMHQLSCRHIHSVPEVTSYFQPNPSPLSLVMSGGGGGGSGGGRETSSIKQTVRALEAPLKPGAGVGGAAESASLPNELEWSIDMAPFSRASRD